jgi:hypothetical protein
MKRMGAATLAVCVAAGLIAGVASGAKIKTSVSLDNPAFGVYEGQVTAKKPCKKGRTVTVWHDTNGNGEVDGEPTDFEIGTGVTDDAGFYTVLGNQAPAGDNIIAVVDKKKKGKKKCKDAEALTEAEGSITPTG